MDRVMHAVATHRSIRAAMLGLATSGHPDMQDLARDLAAIERQVRSWRDEIRDGWEIAQALGGEGLS